MPDKDWYVFLNRKKNNENSDMILGPSESHDLQLNHLSAASALGWSIFWWEASGSAQAILSRETQQPTF